MNIEKNNFEHTNLPERLSDQARAHKAAELILNPIEEGEAGYDNIFLTGKISKAENNSFIVDIDDSDTTVALNDKIKDMYDLSDIPTVPEIRNGGEKSLISGGSWLQIKDIDGKILMPFFRRDSNAPSDPNCLTGPAGRCGEPLSKTSIDETNQEIMIICNDKEDKPKLLAFYRNDSDIDRTVDQKMKQIEENIENLNAKFSNSMNEKDKKQIDILKSLDGVNSIELVKIEDTDNDSQNFDTIFTRVNGVVVDEVKGIAYMDEKNNTLEVRGVLPINLPAGHRILAAIDGEKFSRDTFLVEKNNLEDIKNDDLVPALKNYVMRTLVGSGITKSVIKK